MKNLNLSLTKGLAFKVLAMAAFLASTLSFAQQNEKSSEFSFESNEIDYGTIDQYANGERTFKFTNTGDAPLIISKVKTSCGCTVPTYPKEPVMPGEKAEIKVKYATNRLGAFSKTITITSNAKGGAKILKIKGNILKKENAVEEITQ